MPYMNPGAVASEGVSNFLMDREDRQRKQAVEDLKMQQAKLELEQAQVNAKNAALDRERADVTREQSGLVPGDVPDAGLIERSKRVHMPLPLKITKGVEAPAGSPEVQMPSAEGQNIEVPPGREDIVPSDIVTMPGQVESPKAPDTNIYLGDPAFRKTQMALQQKQAQQQQVAKALQDGAEPTEVMESALAAGMDADDAKKIIEAVRPDTIGVWQIDRKTGKMVKVGEANKGDHFATEAPTVNVNGGGASGPLDEGMIDMWAASVAKGAPMPSFAGAHGTAIKEAIGKRAAQFDTQLGNFVQPGMKNAHPPNIRDQAIGFASDRSAGAQLAKTFVMTEAFSDAARLNVAKLQDVMEHIPDSNFPVVNSITRGLAKNMGDVNVTKFNTYRESVKNEFARIITQINGGQLTDNAREEMKMLIAPDASVAQINGAIDALSQEAASRSQAYQSWATRISGGAGNVGGNDNVAPPGGGAFRVVGVRPAGK